jgi:amino acid adenylation domain-containing protein
VSLPTIYSKQEVALSDPLTIDQILRRQAAQTPNAIAIAASGRKPLTYHELIDQVDYVAHFLAKSGFSQKDCVAIVLPNGPEMAIAFLGVSSGAISAPLNPGYREDEFDFYLSELNVRALIVQSGSDSPAIPVAQRRNIGVIDLSPLVDAAAGLFHLRAEQINGSSIVHRAEPTDVALILHTSGTTSRSKMVPLTHSNLLASARNITTRLGLTSDDRCLNVMPLFHIHGLIGAVLSSLMAGGSVVCTSAFDPEAFLLWLKEFYPTWYTAVPAMHQAVLSCAQANGNLRAGNSLRFIRSSSAALAPGVMRELEAVFGIPVIEAYGMTEAAHQITSNPLPPRQRKAGSVGLPAGADVSIMDEGGNLLSPGEIGEIVIRGANVMSGYANNPEANTESFASEWFRTGDQGYLDAEGYVFITGRLKEMINRGGEKVSPRDVDEVLLEHPAVAEAVSFAVPHITLGEDVAAAVVLREKKSVTDSELQRFAAVRIAEFKVPRRVLIVDEIPKGPTGKVQRGKLAERLGLTASDGAQRGVEIEYTAPRNPIEQKLVEIWSQVLGIKRVGIYDNLFHLGGDSIHAARIISRMRELMGIEFPFGVFFEAPTVAAIARVIETPGTQVQSRRLSPAEKQETGPLSHGQEALWFLDQFDPGNPAYNRPVFARVQGNLNVSVLQRCLDELVQRHAVLRASFLAADDKPIQRIRAYQPFSLPVIDIAHLTEFEREAHAAKTATEEARRPFDLARGPLFRASLLRLAEQLHVLLFTTHHIVFDGWSSEIFLRELTMLYEALSNDRPSLLPELPVQYSDFVRWQRETMADEPLKNQVAYWRRQLNDSWPIINLPMDRPRASIRTSNGASRSFTLASSLTEKLNEISRQERVSLFMTLLASFKTLLYRYAGQKDIIVGAPFAGRNQSSIENLVGLFINTLPLRTDLSGDPTFRELLARVRTTCVDAHANQDIPFERIVSELQLKRDTGRPGIYQVLFQLRNYPRQLARGGDLDITEYKADSGGSICDLSLAISEEKNGLECCFEYCTDLFDAAGIDRMWGHFQSLLQNIVANPDARLSALSILTEAERQQLLVGWNDTNRDYPRDECIPRLFEAQVERTPNATAVIFEDKRMTYHELNERANQLAHYLHELGVEPEALVGLCMERSLEMVVGVLGVLKAGGAYVPLDPNYPKARLAYMLAQTRVKFVLTQERLLENLADFKGRVLCLDGDRGCFEYAHKQNLNVHIEPTQLAYVTFTSGSTGKPKGVLSCHLGVVNYFSYLLETYNLNDTDTVLQIPSLSFDASVRDLIGPLTAGAQVVIVNDFDAKDPVALLNKISEHRVTCILSIVPTLLNGVLEAAQHKDLRPDSIRVVLVAGEALTNDSCQRAKEVFGQTAWIINQYGPTESTLTCAYHRILEPDHHRGIVPLGRPIANARLYILDEHLRLVPIGSPGELHVGGIGLTRGYVNSPELTAERFIPHPFSDDPGARLYKTGDLGRYTPDGRIEFLGRIDHQVKIRGFRIELGEIEAVLAEHPGVQQAVAVVPEDSTRSDRVIAYVVPNNRQALGKNDLRDFLRSKLPEYMVPSALVLLDEFPLTPNRKIDRRALPPPNPAESELSDATYAAPRNLVEEMLVGIWSDVLKLERIGIQDNFFDLGGHSLLATQVMSRTCQALQVDLPLRALFERPTVAELSIRIEEANGQYRRLSTRPIVAVSRDKDLPLSFSQQRLWFLDQYEPKSSAYNIQSALRLQGSLDVMALEQSLNEIIRRHESLRTTFSTVDGEPVQVIAPSVQLSFQVVNLTSYPESEREEEARRLIGEDASRPFDLANGPLFRAKLLRLGEEDHVLLLTMHHIVSDGWSMGILHHELSVLYYAFSSGEPSPLPELPVQYADFAVWQREWLQGEILESQLPYWKKQLEGLPEMLDLLTDQSRLLVQSHRGARQSFLLSKDLTEKLKALSRKQGVTLYMALLASFKVLIYRYTGQEDVVIGSPIAGRNRPELDGLIGFFVNTLVLRSDLSGNPVFCELLKRIREVCLGAYAHQELPLQMLVEALRPKGNTGRRSLARIFFAYQNVPRHPFEIPGVTVTQIRTDLDVAKAPLTLFMWESQECLSGSFSYSADLFHAVTIRRMIEHFQTLLSAIVADPEKRLLDIPPNIEQSRSELLEAIHWANALPSHFEIHEIPGREHGEL